MKDALFANNRSYVHHIVLNEAGDPLSKRPGFLRLAQLIDALEGILHSYDEDQVQSLLDAHRLPELVEQLHYDGDTLQVIALCGTVSLTLPHKEIQSMTISELYDRVAQNLFTQPANPHLSLVTSAGEKLDRKSAALVTTALDIAA
jgi:hypothetical protein